MGDTYWLTQKNSSHAEPSQELLDCCLSYTERCGNRCGKHIWLQQIHEVDMELFVRFTTEAVMFACLLYELNIAL